MLLPKIVSFIYLIDDTPQKGEVCFIKNSAKAICYKLNSQAKDFFKTSEKMKLNFYTESGTGYDSVLAESPALFWSYPLSFYNHEEFRLVAPNLSISTSYSGYAQYPVILVYQSLELSVDQLNNLNELTGKYTLEPYTKEK